ncbi:MAG: hypothetical protein IIZ93_14135 [Acidaminococcaceae bacterium]|nr:hypothetical protein [Acidaminococcaceae bacterium]
MNEELTREQCEKLIQKKLYEIIDIYHRYNPDGNYLNLAYMNEDDDQFIMVNNANYPAMDGDTAGEDFDCPIDFRCSKNKEGIA